MEYNIAQASNREKLVERVNSFIQKGWRPIGGVMYDFEETVVSSTGTESHSKYAPGARTSERHHAISKSVYFQAMIKE